MAAKPTYFKTQATFRTWLAKHHASEAELLVGFYKRDSGKASITWPESVDEALCVGWIDGVRRSLGEESYAIRFSPRQRTSTWSAVNIARVKVLTEEGRMRPSGLAAFAARRENRSGIYAYEQRTAEIPPPYDAILRKNKPASKFFEAQPPGYRKKLAWWVVSAKTDATRMSRLDRLIEASARGERLG